MKTLFACTLALSSLGLGSSAYALNCKTSDGTASLVINEDVVPATAVLNQSDVSITLSVLDKEFFATRVGAETAYTLKDGDGVQAKLLVKESQVFNPGHCNRAGCDGGFFKTLLTGTLDYKSTLTSMKCYEPALLNQ